MRTRAWLFTACRSTAPPGAQRDNDHLVSLLCFLSTDEWKGLGIARVYVISRCTARAQPFPPKTIIGPPPSWIMERPDTHGLRMRKISRSSPYGSLQSIANAHVQVLGELLPSMVTRLSVPFTLADRARLSPAACRTLLSRHEHKNPRKYEVKAAVVWGRVTQTSSVKWLMKECEGSFVKPWTMLLICYTGRHENGTTGYILITTGMATAGTGIPVHAWYNPS